MATVLLTLKNDFDNNDLIKEILKALSTLTKEKNYKGTKIPSFFIYEDNFIENGTIQNKECELLDQGMAHGISAPLTLLSLALKEGIEVEGQKEAIGYMLNFLKKYNYEDEYGIWWYGRLTLDEFKKNERSKIKNRAAWCYGSPSIARAIYISSSIIGDREGKELALRCFDKLCNHTGKDLFLKSPTICHGLSGLIMTLNEMYIDTNKELYKNSLNNYIDELLMLDSKSYLFRFRNYEVENVLEGKANYVYKNDIGLIDGSLGVISTLMDYELRECSSYKRIFLIN